MKYSDHSVVLFFATLFSAMGLGIGFPGKASADAVDDAYSVVRGDTLSVAAPGVLENDCCADSDPGFGAALVEPADGQLENGTVILNSDGSFEYLSDSDSTGTLDTFTYTNSTYQPQDLTNQAQVSISIADGPSISTQPDEYSIVVGDSFFEGAPGVLANDSDSNGDALTASLVSGTMEGSLSLNSDGSFLYQHNGTSQVDDSFTYTVSDGTNTSDPETVTIKVMTVSGGILVTFPNVQRVGLDGILGTGSDLRLRVASSSGTPASVSGDTHLTQVAEMVAELPNSNSRDAAETLFARCERLALIAQARPTKYDFKAEFQVENQDSQIIDGNPDSDGSANSILISVDPGTIQCDLVLQ